MTEQKKKKKKEKYSLPNKQERPVASKRDGGRVWGVYECVCVCVQEDVLSVCVRVQCLYVTPVCSAFGLEYLYVFIISPEWLGKQTARLLMSGSVEYARCIHEREKRKGVEGERERAK